VHFRHVSAKIWPKNVKQHFDWEIRAPWAPSGYVLDINQHALVSDPVTKRWIPTSRSWGFNFLQAFGPRGKKHISQNSILLLSTKE